MIQKVGLRVVSTGINNKSKVNQQKSMQNPISQDVSSSVSGAFYNVSFTSKKSEKDYILENSYTQNTVELFDDATQIAKKFHHPEVTEDHFEAAALVSLLNYLDELDAGAPEAEADSSYTVPALFKNMTTEEVFASKELRDKVKVVAEEELNLLEGVLSDIPKSRFIAKPSLSRSFSNNIYDFSKTLSGLTGDGAEMSTDPATVLTTIFTTESKNKHFKDFLFKFQEAVMLDNRDKKKVKLSMYDHKAKNVLKNLSLGTNMFITHDKTSDPAYYFNSIIDVFENQKHEFGKMTNDNTELVLINDYVKDTYFTDKVKELAKDKDKNYIVMMNLDKMLINSAQTVMMSDGSYVKQPAFSKEFQKMLKKLPSNVKLVFSENKNGYFANMSNPNIKAMYENFGEAYYPAMTAEQAKEAFKEQPLLTDELGIPFNKKAIDKAVEVSGPLEGGYPEKTKKLMKQIASYYIDNEVITEKEVKNYVDETKNNFKLAADGSSIEIVFDTGKKLKDMIGKPATKKEAESIVNQIKRGILGTKGAIIYSQDGSVGAGRKFTAKAIAGEANAPYLEFNAMDFGVPDVSVFKGETMSPDAAISKVFALATAQAESNPHKAAVIYVDNFEYLSLGENISEYYPKAMSRLLWEMDSANKKGLNILILGSVSDPDYVGSTTAKSFKFIDTIEVESPAYNVNARKDILNAEVKKNKIKIVGETQQQKDEIINLLAETTKYFSNIELVSLIKKANLVAFERGHKSVDKSDAVEAYLQLTTGRPSSGPIQPHEKKIVTSHECGHALTLEVMHDALAKENIPQTLPERVNFITLDPRGWYGGAMYEKDGPNHERSLETTLSYIVCCFGGHSAEKHFYGMDGSWGITADMEMATNKANTAVRYMGQGFHTGKISVGGMHQKPSERQQEIMDKDVDIMLRNGLLLSDYITEVYADFNKEFTKKYSDLVGTGDCLVHGDDFRHELAEWKANQSPEKRAEMELLDEMILDVIKSTKKGKLYGQK